MPYLLINQKPFEEVSFDQENELEQAVIKNKEFIFGPNIVYLDYKRRVGDKESVHIGIPDGFLFDFSNLNKPQLFFVEYELESHDLYDHIGAQIMKFYASFEQGKHELQVKLINIIKKDKSVKRQLEKLIQNSQFENLDALLNFVIYDQSVGIILIIDEQSEDLNALLRRLSEVPEVIVVKKYKAGNDIVYQYNPFREGVSEDYIAKNKSGKKLEDVDTIVCPARPEGFKHAFIDNNAWWAIRISPSLIPQLRYIAMYEVSPVRAVQWMGKIKQNGIQPYKNTGRYIVYLEGRKKIGPIKLDQGRVGVAPQAPRYTTYKKLSNAKKISNLW